MLSKSFVALTLPLALWSAGSIDLLAAQEPRVQTVLRYQPNERADAGFQFDQIGPPSKTDAGNIAKVTVLAGRPDGNSAGLSCLTDGQTPRLPDQPRRNFFFDGRGRGGRIMFDLGTDIDVREIRAYSWHPNVRGPQVYQVYGAAAGDETTLELQRSDDPSRKGWSPIAEVDTRELSKVMGGQYASAIRTRDGAPLGSFRYVLFEVHSTSDRFNGAETFFSEIDLLDGKEYELVVPERRLDTVLIDDQYKIDIDTTEVPELQPWVQEVLVPVCKSWYPRIVELLPSDSYEAPRAFTIVFKSDMEGVAFASGTQITGAGPWYLRNKEGEGPGSIVHEMVHVVQQYRRPRGGNRNPGWMVEGVADYIRWFIYEPVEKRPRVNPDRANFDDSYRTTGAFLDYAVKQYDKELVTKFNAKMRQGEYSDELWKAYTGKTAAEIWAEFAATLRK